MPRPNIILIICDQMRGDALGADGNPIIQTPNLDAIAASGTRFSHAYSACPSCLPARATLWTGQTPWHTGLLGMGRGQGPIPNDYPHTLPGELSQAGYRTHLVGKGHFEPQRTLMGFQSSELDESGRMDSSEHRRWFQEQAPAGVTPDDHGVSFNSWHARPWHTGEHLHPSAWTMTRAIEFLAHRDPGQPYFLNISFARPHSPYVPPAYYFDLYHRGKTPPPRVGDWAEEPAGDGAAPGPDAWCGRMTPEQIHRARAGYYGEISFIDSQLGRLLNWMRRHPRESGRDDTWIIFVSDHGDMQGDHHLWRKTYAYEGSARIPVLVRPPPGVAPPVRRVADEVVELRDIMPTALQIAGCTHPVTVEGCSLLPLLQAPAPDWRPYLHGEHCACYAPAAEMQYVTNGRRKLIWLPHADREQFFDLEADPGECRDLARTRERRDEVAQWRSYLVRELEARDCGWVRNGMPFRPDAAPLYSPWRDRRWPGPAS